MKYANGMVYDGEWKNDLRHGFGVLTWPDGRKYEGDYKEGLKDG